MFLLSLGLGCRCSLIGLVRFPVDSIDQRRIEKKTTATFKILHQQNTQQQHNSTSAEHDHSTMSEFWIYHERQQAQLCGQHALNNLVQGSVFSANDLADIALQLGEQQHQ